MTLSNHILLGRRPSGLIEAVDPLSGLTSFLAANNPTPSEITLLVCDPRDMPFTSRDRSFLTLLRTKRLEALAASKRAKKSTTPKGSKNARSTTSKRRSTAVSTSQAVSEQLGLAGFDTATAEKIRQSIAGLSSRNGPAKR